ncbi:MAG: Gfo/Idh/MocA family oxidoreductase [Lentisphaerae bacterium]|nr:Gfo/Idh/MocA family oxidoreductase [Lentisphaerota bacterium]MBT4819515.1 Gfo/Idh/MocA family oxidoreductase [Lentisphaerota bacterium]MBT5610394.1 Gfo/Idh/MocA family oxidoreductase [Lentisphaerota bacterium]MBT7056222.1 Gfo/Idh/MocA family oxidoreductase [Lentisphaerota bacterium]MBT7841856.1 Gfo/Idh/MocA family oxidoreductase [Lentisphaerota bacterium]
MAAESALRFGLVGLGLVGPAHARSLAELADADLTIACDICEERVRAFADEYGCDWTTDINDVLSRGDIDVVSVTTPQFTHHDLAIASAKAGKHVIVEKPIDINTGRAQEIIDVCHAQGVKLGVIFQSRWKKSFVCLKEAVEAGQLGRLLLGDAYIKWFRPQEYYDSSAWRGKWETEGGAALINQSSHTIDTLQWIMGPVESLFAYFTTTPVHNIEADDLGVATLKFKNGALGVIEGATALRPGLPERLEVHGEKGTVIIEGGAIKLWDVEGMDEGEMKEEAEEPVGTGASDPMAFPISWHKAQIQDMIDAIRDDREPKVNGEEGLRALRIIEAIYKSGRSGVEVTL